MEFQSIYAGFWSLVPAIVSIVMALILKEILSSLLVGIFVGSLIYSFFSNLGIIYSIKLSFNSILENLSSNASVIVFTSLLGIISQVIIDAGVTSGYTKWSEKRIKSSKSAQLSSIFLSFLCSIDDAFLCLTVGNVMRPVTDKNKVSRARLAYIIDMMASPLSVIMPISSWAVAIVACISSSGLPGMDIFLRSIVFNFYPIFSVFLAIVSSFTRGFGPMRHFEEQAKKGNDLTADKNFNEKSVDNDSKAWELILPILVLLLGSVFMILETGGVFSGGTKSFSEIMENTNSELSLNFGSLLSILVSLLIFVPKRMSFTKFMDSVSDGVKSMTSINVMLILAWSMTSICRSYLSIGDYIRDVISYCNISEFWIPITSFLLSSLLSFAVGSSWATFGILIPIISTVVSGMSPNTTVLAISAILSGSIAGVNCSPVASMGLLASTGAGCKHLDHISSQVPYVILSSSVAAIGFLFAPLFSNIVILYIAMAFIMILLNFFLSKIIKKIQKYK